MVRPLGHAILTLLSTVIAAAIIAFLVYFSMTRNAHVAGVLLPSQGLVRIQLAQTGVITESRVHEGQAVKAGDVLFVVQSERASATRGDAERTISSLLQARRDSMLAERAQQGQQARQRMAALQRRTDDLQAESVRIDEQIALQQRRVALATSAVQRLTDLQNDNFVSAASVQDRQADLLDQQQRLAELHRARAANARDSAAAQADLRDQQVQAQRDQQAATRGIAAIEQDLTENEARRAILIRAAQDGTVTAIATTPGASVATGQTLATLLPANAELEAELYAPSRAAGFVKPGMPVLLRYQAYPYQKFGQFEGQVREVSQSPMQAADLALPAIAQGGTGSEPVYRVRVRLSSQAVRAYGQEKALKAGMALEASVLLERRRLYEWVLEPLYSISGRV